jgi:TonB-dependent receptor
MRSYLESRVSAAATTRTRAALFGGASASALALAALGMASPAMAQTTTDTPAADAPATADEIIVTGYRASLESAQKTKRNSDTIVDSVTADDIGALPDRSVTETLQRIPGISINRFAAGVDPDHFSAEGSGVVVRGLTYVRSEFNGRDAFTANNGRALGFADVPSELLGGVDVYKSLPADHIEGGIAGTVDLKTRKPFDSNKGLFAASIEDNYSDFARKHAPSGAAVASMRWNTGIGEIGILGSLSYSKLFSRSDRLAVSHFKNRCYVTAGGVTTVSGAPTIGTPCPAGTSAGLIPSGAVQGTQNFERERLGMSAALQWRSSDGAIEAVAQFIRSDAKEAWSERTVEVTTDNVDNNGGVLAAPGTTLGFDSSGLFTNGVITGNTGWRNDQNGTARTPINGLQSNNIRRDHLERDITQDISANVKWKVTDRLTAVFDYQHATSEVEVDDNTLWASTYQDASIRLNGNNLPSVTFLPPTNCAPNCSGAVGTANNPAYYIAPNNSFTSPANSFYRSSMDHTERSDGYLNAFRVDLKYDFSEDSFIKSAKIGFRYSDRNQTARFSTYNWGVLSEQWGGNPATGNGPIWLDTPIASNGNRPLSSYELFAFPNFFGGAVPSPAGPGRLFYSGNTITDYAGYSAYAQQINAAWTGGGWTPLASRAGVVTGTPFLPGEINPATERNNAIYAMVNFGTEFSGGAKLSGNIGLRYTRTKRISYGGAFVAGTTNTFATRQATCAVPVPVGQSRDPFCLLGTDVQAALIASNSGGAAAYVPSVARLNYDFWLPSFNAKLEVGGGLQFRAAYFKGVAPPDFGLTRNYSRIDAIQVVVNPNAPTAPFLSGSVTSGNPFLLPTSSDNFDLTAEYYFGQGGQLTVSGFYKVLRNVVTNDTFSGTVPVGSANANITGYRPVNSPDTGKVKGFEVSYQQNYSFLPGIFSGLGLQANYTFVDSSGVKQSVLSATDPNVAAGNISNIPGESFPLQGLSRHTVNIVPYFEKGPFTIRAAYTWRSSFLLTLRDVITPFDPIFQRPYGQLDASVSYAVTKNVKLGIQGVNLLDSLVETSAAVYDQSKNIVQVPRAWYKTDRRFTFSAKVNF